MDHIPLGKATPFPDRYDRSLLAPIERAVVRRAMGIGATLPFAGEDVWHGYELSWLNPRGLPRVAALRLQVGADSPCMVESKSMKLYVNGFAQTAFESREAVTHRLREDLSQACGATVAVAVMPLAELPAPAATLPGVCLDDLNVATDVYERDPDLLRLTGGGVLEETLHTHLFRSLCPVTGQPDWASVLVRYRGPAVDREALLRYLVSFRQHQAFHETTIEQIFLDLKDRCRSEELMVAGYFLRRGGVDISPVRSDGPWDWPLVRTVRQ